MSSPDSPFPPSSEPDPQKEPIQLPRPPVPGQHPPAGVFRTMGVPAPLDPAKGEELRRQQQELQEKRDSEREKAKDKAGDAESGAGSGIEGKVAVLFILIFLSGYMLLIYALKSKPEDRPVQSWLKELDRRVTNKAHPLPAGPATDRR